MISLYSFTFGGINNISRSNLSIIKLLVNQVFNLSIIDKLNDIDKSVSYYIHSINKCTIQYTAIQILFIKVCFY
jgi:hypothetical protein